MTSASKPFVIPVFLPHRGCPHQCIFCDQTAITGLAVSPRDDKPADNIEKIIRQFVACNHRGRRPVQLSFYGGNFLGLPEKEMLGLLTVAESFVRSGRIDSIRFSTRPDTISRRILDLLMAYTVQTIELGIQSMDDTILRLSGRGHTAAQCETALTLLRDYPVSVGVQMMIGLPGDRGPQSLATAARLVSLRPDFARIYPTVVLTGSPLARLYKNGTYTPLSLQNAVSLTAAVYRMFTDNDIAVIRMGLQPTEELNRPATVLAGPYHPSFGHLVLSELIYDQAAAGIQKESIGPGDTLSIAVHPGNGSIIRGLNNANIKRFKETFGVHAVRIVEDDGLTREQVVCRRTA